MTVTSQTVTAQRFLISSLTPAEKSLQAFVRSKDTNTVPSHQSWAIFTAVAVDNVSVSFGTWKPSAVW